MYECIQCTADVVSSSCTMCLSSFAWYTYSSWLDWDALQHIGQDLFGLPWSTNFSPCLVSFVKLKLTSILQAPQLDTKRPKNCSHRGGAKMQVTGYSSLTGKSLKIKKKFSVTYAVICTVKPVLSSHPPPLHRKWLSGHFRKDDYFLWPVTKDLHFSPVTITGCSRKHIKKRKHHLKI